MTSRAVTVDERSNGSRGEIRITFSLPAWSQPNDASGTYRSRCRGSYGLSLSQRLVNPLNAARKQTWRVYPVYVVEGIGAADMCQ